MITLIVMGVIAGAALTLLFRAYASTGIVENRRDVMGDARVSLEQMTKQIRQATNVYAQTPTSFDFDTYINGVPHRVK